MILFKRVRDSFRHIEDREWLLLVLETLGVLVFIVVVLRLLWRLIDATPAKQPMSRWMAAAAKLVHFALYALVIAIPATAVLGTWLEGIPLTLPGFDIAPQITRAHGLGQLIMEIHTTLGNGILWGTVTVFAALIPSIGSGFVTVPGAIYLLATGHIGNGIGLAIWGLLFIGLVDNVLRPYLLAGRASIHPLLILLSVLGGLALFGPGGLFLGPLIISLLLGLLSIYAPERDDPVVI